MLGSAASQVEGLESECHRPLSFLTTPTANAIHSHSAGRPHTLDSKCLDHDALDPPTQLAQEPTPLSPLSTFMYRTNPLYPISLPSGSTSLVALFGVLLMGYVVLTQFKTGARTLRFVRSKSRTSPSTSSPNGGPSLIQISSKGTWLSSDHGHSSRTRAKDTSWKIAALLSSLFLLIWRNIRTKLYRLTQPAARYSRILTSALDSIDSGNASSSFFIFPASWPWGRARTMDVPSTPTSASTNPYRAGEHEHPTQTASGLLLIDALQHALGVSNQEIPGFASLLEFIRSCSSLTDPRNACPRIPLTPPGSNSPGPRPANDTKIVFILTSVNHQPFLEIINHYPLSTRSPVHDFIALQLVGLLGILVIWRLFKLLQLSFRRLLGLLALKDLWPYFWATDRPNASLDALLVDDSNSLARCAEEEADRSDSPTNTNPDDAGVQHLTSHTTTHEPSEATLGETPEKTPVQGLQEIVSPVCDFAGPPTAIKASDSLPVFRCDVPEQGMLTLERIEAEDSSCIRLELVQEESISQDILRGLFQPTAENEPSVPEDTIHTTIPPMKNPWVLLGRNRTKAIQAPCPPCPPNEDEDEFIIEADRLIKELDRMIEEDDEDWTFAAERQAYPVYDDRESMELNIRAYLQCASLRGHQERARKHRQLAPRLRLTRTL